MGKLTPRERERIAQLDTFLNKVHHARGIVEGFATQPRDAESLSIRVRRTFNQLKLQFTSAGFDTMAQICNNMEAAARFGTNHISRSSKLREGVGTLARLVEQERRSIASAAKSRSDEK